MESCATETGLLKKKPCGQPAVAKCDNCEMPLCSKHAVPQLSPARQRTGRFMCAECDRAHSQANKIAARPAAARPAPKPAPAAPPKPAAGAPAKPPAAAPSTTAARAENSDGSIDFTPTKK
jgi:hypothetical protein